MKLKDRVAIITGATSGIGEASALLFAQEGANVTVIRLPEWTPLKR
jgi:NAD(P)-dependent dehydrogenase (short-subunit alcohol dehydrogenase family)